MSLALPTMSSRVRRLSAKNLSPESYIRELVEIADLEKASIAPEMEHLFDLRGRIRELEMKVRDLETHK